MSANLLDGATPKLMNGTTSESDGTWHHAARTETDGHNDWLVWDLPDQAALETNQTYHVGLSVKGATANSTYLRPAIGYKDSAGHNNWAVAAPFVVGTSWGRAEATIVVPSGMTPFAFYVSAYGTCPETWMASPTLSCGSPVTLASSAHTPYATQDHLRSEYATKAALKVTSDAVTAEVEERGKLAGRVGTLESTSGTHTSKLEQLATSIKSLVKGESTYTDPDGKSATSGIYSLVTQTRDSVTALFGSYTKTADLASTAAVKDAKKAGTDAASAASAAASAASAAQSTANTAKSAASAAQSTADTAKANAATAQSTANTAVTNASKAQSTADAAKGTADGLATMIRQDADGVTVGKSADGKTWSTTRTRMGASAFEVLTKAGEVASSFGEKVIELGKNSQDAVIRMLGGLVTIKATSAGVSDGAWCEISTDEFVSMNGYHASRLAAGYKDESESAPQGVAEVMAQGGEGDGSVLLYAGAHGSDGNSLSLYPGGFTMNHPEYMLSALGLGSYGPVSPSSPYGSLTFCVRAGVATLWVSWGTTADPWGKVQCGEWVVPEAYRPRMDLNAPVALRNRGSGDTGDTRLVVEASTGKIYWQNLGGGHSATTFDALVSWGIE